LDHHSFLLYGASQHQIPGIFPTNSSDFHVRQLCPDPRECGLKVSAQRRDFISTAMTENTPQLVLFPRFGVFIRLARDFVAAMFVALATFGHFLFL